MTSMNGPSARDSASGKATRDAGQTDGQPPRAQFLTVAEVASRDALVDPASIEPFVAYAQERAVRD